MIRDLIRRIPGARKAYQTFKSIQEARTRTIAAEYLQGDGEKKLHIGCGHNVLKGWLNSDFSPALESVIQLDATNVFPISSDSFDYIFSEHMIEHISYTDGLTMLKESFRVLKPGGKIRVSTPNLQFLIDLHSEPKTPIQLDYIAWATEKFIKSTESSDTIVINNFVRDWGHKFIYDQKTLSRSLEMAGFKDIEHFDVNQSNDLALRNLENASRMPSGFLQLESFTLEATKPRTHTLS